MRGQINNSHVFHDPVYCEGGTQNILSPYPGK